MTYQPKFKLEVYFRFLNSFYMNTFHSPKDHCELEYASISISPQYHGAEKGCSIEECTDKAILEILIEESRDSDILKTLGIKIT